MAAALKNQEEFNFLYMPKNLEPKCKKCRRIGEKLLLKGSRCVSSKCAMVKKNYPPGFHGQKGKQRLSDFGTQLREKQKAKIQYNLLEKQFKLTYMDAKKKGGNVGEAFISLLESRLDNAIYRLGLAESRGQAREMVSHGHFLVKGKKVNIPSFKLKQGDIIKVKTSSQRKKYFKNLSEKNYNISQIPGWISFEPKELTAKIVGTPNAAEAGKGINTQMIVEFYSR
jgi:small subunit ribosomal protein S4